MTDLILASASTPRASMLRAAGVRFRAVPADIDEAAIKNAGVAVGHAPNRIATDIAAVKARHILAGHPGATVLGSDQILVHRGRLFSKPDSLGEARNHLSQLRGDSHQLVSAAALVTGDGPDWTAVQQVTMTMRPFTDRFLDDYLDQIGDRALTSVGCYHLEGLGAQMFTSIDGDYFAVLGLPLLPVLQALRETGILTQ